MNAAAPRGAFVCGGLALAIAAPAQASGSPITDATALAVLVAGGLWLCMLATTLVVAFRRWRRRGRAGLWYLLVPVEATAIFAIVLSFNAGLPNDHPLARNAAVSMAGVLLMAWGIAHLLHSGQRLDAQPGPSSDTAG